MRLQSLVTKPLVSFKDLVGQYGSLQSHENHIYHKRAVEAAQEFLKPYHDPNRDVTNQLDKKRLAEIADNRNRLKPIIESVIFLGRQNIPFRGHWDDGDVLKEKPQSQLSEGEDPSRSDVINEGNFRELIRFRIRSGDSILEAHLKNTSSRATYISKTSQNDFIKLCGEEIRQEIIRRVGEAGIYSLLFDETTDVSGKSQISFSVKYVSDGCVREDFICFVDAFEELTKEREQKKQGTEKDTRHTISEEGMETVNSEEEDPGQEDSEKEDSGKKNSRKEASQEIDVYSDCEGIISDKEEFESVRNEIRKLRRRRVKLVREEDKNKGFVELASVTEESELYLTRIALGRLIRRKIRRFKLNPTKCVGIGCDSCAVNVSDTVGAVKEIQSEAINAQKVPCYSNKLNNSLSITSKVQEVNCAVGIMKEVISFFSSHPKRLTVLQKHVGVQLKSLCETRWVDRHDGVLQFLQDLPSICDALDEIARWRDTHTAGKAASLASSLQEPKFVVTLVCLSDLLSHTIVLSRSPQKKNTDLMQASAEVGSLITVLTQRRENAEKEFAELYKKATKTAAALDISLTIPRRSVRQTLRANYVTESPEVYYRLAIYIPMLDHFLTDTKHRFPQSVLDVFHLPALVPDCLLGLSREELDSSAELMFNQFSNVLKIMGVELSTNLTVLKTEITLWREKWASIKKSNPQKAIPSTAIEALHDCSVDVYTVVHPLLKILCTLPVSNATPERTFSSHRRLKTWLRATMDQTRLTGLALMSTHRDINIDIDQVIDQFAKNGYRRLPFIL